MILNAHIFLLFFLFFFFSFFLFAALVGIHQRSSLQHANYTSECLPVGAEWPDGILGIHEAAPGILHPASDLMVLLLPVACR